jgi:hypothetical protein
LILTAFELLLAMEKRGVDIIIEYLPVSVEGHVDTLTVVARQPKDGLAKRFAVELAVLGAGRIPIPWEWNISG